MLLSIHRHIMTEKCVRKPELRPILLILQWKNNMVGELGGPSGHFYRAKPPTKRLIKQALGWDKTPVWPHTVDSLFLYKNKSYIDNYTIYYLN